MQQNTVEKLLEYCLFVGNSICSNSVLSLPSKSYRSGTTGSILTNDVTKCFCFCDLYMKVNGETFG